MTEQKFDPKNSSPNGNEIADKLTGQKISPSSAAEVEIATARVVQAATQLTENECIENGAVLLTVEALDTLRRVAHIDRKTVLALFKAGQTIVARSNHADVQISALTLLLTLILKAKQRQILDLEDYEFAELYQVLMDVISNLATGGIDGADPAVRSSAFIVLYSINSERACALTTQLLNDPTIAGEILNTIHSFDPSKAREVITTIHISDPNLDNLKQLIQDR
jgi:hypothetical protein